MNVRESVLEAHYIGNISMTLYYNYEYRYVVVICRDLRILSPCSNKVMKCVDVVA